MKILLSWLGDFIPVKHTPEELAEVLTIHSVEVDGIARPGQDIDETIVVGLVKNVKPHPNADRLRLATVDLGEKEMEVVCGAPNIATGQKIAFAQVGSRIRGKDGKMTALTAVVIRGVTSEGMICSSAELGLSETADTIMTLDPKAAVGDPVRDLIGKDAVLDLDVLANRPDLMGHRGVAREVAALTGVQMKRPTLDLPKPKHGGLQLDVAVKEGDACPRYSALVLSGLDGRESPPHVQHRLRSVGIRPIGAVVDATNYLMMHLGVPFHAFDYDRVTGNAMVIRLAEKGEAVRTLDGIDRKLQKGMLVIEDKEQLIDLAGIMGGERSAVTEKTTRIILQAAVFDAMTIRGTSRTLGHRTDAVSIYEKGVDPNGTLDALTHAFHFLKEQFPDMVLERIVDEIGNKRDTQQIDVPVERITALLGMPISASDVQQILLNLGCAVKEKSGVLQVVPPTWRFDLIIPEDIIEEVGRVNGYDRIPETLPAVTITPSEPVRTRSLRRFADMLVGAGYTEAVNVSMLGEESIRLLGLDPMQHVPVRNPMTPDQAFLRRYLLPGLLRNVRNNLRYAVDVCLFECGGVFIPDKEGVLEQRNATVVATADGSDDRPLYRIKGLAELVLTRFGVSTISADASMDMPFAIPGRQFVLGDGKQTLAYVFEVRPDMLRKEKIKRRVVACSVRVDDLLARVHAPVAAQPLPVYPPVTRDIAFWIDGETSYADLVGTIRKTDKLITDTALFDRYQKGDRTSYAIRVTYASPTRTLTGDEVDTLHTIVCNNLITKHHVEIRA